MSWDRHLVWHVVDSDDCVVGAWSIEERAAEQAHEVGGYYELVVNVLAGQGPKGCSLTYAPRPLTGERVVLRSETRGQVVFEHEDWPAWAAIIGKRRASPSSCQAPTDEAKEKG